MLAFAARASVLFALLNCGHAPSCPTPGERAPCEPYLEAFGEYLVPPAGWITFRPGTPLVVTSFPPSGGGMYEVAPATNDSYRGLGGGRASFARDVELHDGIVALRGAKTVIAGAANGKVGVHASNNQLYVVPCHALAETPIEPAAEPIAATSRLRVLLEDAILMPGWLWHLWPGQRVELLAVDADRAHIRFAIDGFVYTGWVGGREDGVETPLAGVLGMPGEFPDPEMRIEQHPGGDPVVLLGTERTLMATIGHECSGAAMLRGRSPMLSGPVRARTARDNRTPMREIPAIDRDVEVTLRAAFDDYRAVEINDPSPEVTSIVAWVRAADLDRPTCEMP